MGPAEVNLDCGSWPQLGAGNVAKRAPWPSCGPAHTLVILNASSSDAEDVVPRPLPTPVPTANTSVTQSSVDAPLVAAPFTIPARRHGAPAAVVQGQRVQRPTLSVPTTSIHTTPAYKPPHLRTAEEAAAAADLRRHRSFPPLTATCDAWAALHAAASASVSPAAYMAALLHG